MSVILAGKRDSLRHSTTGFGQNVVLEETSYQMFKVLSFYVRKRAYPPTIKITMLTFLVKKKVVWSFPGQDNNLISMDHYTFLGNCPPTPPRNQHETYFSLRAKCWLRGGVGGQFPRNV